MSLGAAPITDYDPSQYGGVRAPLQYSVAFASRRVVALWPIIAVRCRVLPVGGTIMLQLIGWVGIKPALLLFFVGPH